MRRRGFFITFEGLDGSGKTTQLTRLAESLRTGGQDVVATREPGGSAIGERIRSILLDSRTSGLSALAELALMFADRAQHIEQVIAPALEEGKAVLCDRYTDSTVAYQGFGRELGAELVLDLQRQLCRDLWPDITFLLESDLDASIARARSRNLKSNSREGRFEKETAEFFRRVHSGFESMAELHPQRVVRISSGSIEEVESRIMRALQRRFPEFREAARTVQGQTK